MEWDGGLGCEREEVGVGWVGRREVWQGEVRERWDGEVWVGRESCKGGLGWVGGIVGWVGGVGKAEKK